MDRGTLSQILSGKRPASRIDRLGILKAEGMPPDILARFCPDNGTSLTTDLRSHGEESGRPQSEASASAQTEPGNDNAASLLEIARGLRASSQFSESRTILLNLLRDALASENRLLQVELAADLSWLEYEQGFYQQALEWYRFSADALKSHTGFALEEIVKSLRVRGQSSLLSASDRAAHLLSHILHIRRKILIERAVYGGNGTERFAVKGFVEAWQAVQDGAELDRFLNLDRTRAHNDLWVSILLVNGEQIRDREARRSLEEARSIFPRGGLGDLYLDRARGIFYCRTGEERLARKHLLEAVEGFPSFVDARALGPTFYWLSQVEQEGYGGTYEQRGQRALRYALAGTVVHPYGFVRQNAIDLLINHDAKPFLQDARSEIEAGRGLPFKIVHQVLHELAYRTGKAVSHVIQKNLALTGIG
jgi:tetratricopeptide (TPR) repeat protein